MKNSSIKKIILIFTTFFLVSACCNDDDKVVAEKQGKVNIYIEGDITNAEAQAQLADELGSATQNIYVQNTTQLTTINIHSTTNIRYIEFINNANLVNINISGFKKISELWFKNEGTFSGPNAPKNINCNDLEEVQYLNIILPYTSPGHNISFNKLKKVGPNDFTLLAECNELNFPLLETVNTFNFAVKKDIITFPALKHIEKLEGPAYIEFSQLNFPALEYCKRFNINPWEWNQSAIVTIPQLQYCEYFRFWYAVNDSNVTNTVLNQFTNTLPTSGKFIAIGGGNPPSPPTGQGIIDKQNLINNGNSVYTD